MKQTKRVATILKNKRIELGYSQRGIANELGLVKPQYISNVERNLCGLSVKYLHRLSKVIEMPIDVMVKAYRDDYTDFVTSELDKQVSAYWKNNEA